MKDGGGGLTLWSRILIEKLCSSASQQIPCIVQNRRFITVFTTARPQSPSSATLIESILDDWLTVHRSITLFDLQLDAQNSYLFTYNTFTKILYMFQALTCSSSGGLRHSSIYAASGIVTLCRWLPCAPVKKEEFFLNRCTRQSPAESDDTRGCIYTIMT